MKIEFNSIWEFLGAFGFTTLTVGSGIIFIAKKLFDGYLKKSLEKYKSDLERITLIQQTQFNSLHKERAEIIKILYWSLYNYNLAVLDFIDGGLNEAKPIEHLNKKLDEWSNSVLIFSTTFHKNKIFFSKELSNLLNNLNNQMDVLNEDTKTFLASFQLAKDQVGAIKSKDGRFLTLSNKLRELLEKTLSIQGKLEDEFRNLLGVNIKHMEK